MHHRVVLLALSSQNLQDPSLRFFVQVFSPSSLASHIEQVHSAFSNAVAAQVVPSPLHSPFFQDEVSGLFSHEQFTLCRSLPVAPCTLLCPICVCSFFLLGKKKHVSLNMQWLQGLCMCPRMLNREGKSGSSYEHIWQSYRS